MQRLQGVLVVVGISFTAAWIATASPKPGELPRYVLTDREAFVLEPPVLVATPPVAAAEWSADGRYALAARQAPPERKGQPPTGEVSLLLWTRRTGHSQEVWKRPPGVQELEQIHWLPGSSIALVVFAWLQQTAQGPAPHRTLLRVDASRAQAQSLADIPTATLHISPTQPMAVLLATEEQPEREEQTARIVRADGGIGPPIKLPRVFYMTHWSPDGASFYLQRMDAPSAPGLPPVSHWYRLDLRAGTVQELLRTPTLYEEKALPVHLKLATATLKEEASSQRVRPLWLESAVKSEQPRALVCADSDQARLAPNATGVLYLAQGAAWAAPVTRLPRSQMETQVLAAARQEAVERAKQIGLALSMYAQDYDEVYPPAGEGVINRIRPYVKSDDASLSPGGEGAGFVYLLDAVTASSFKDPAATMLGYLPGPGGRAVIYVDGHVEWKGDGPR